LVWKPFIKITGAAHALQTHTCTHSQTHCTQTETQTHVPEGIALNLTLKKALEDIDISIPLKPYIKESIIW